VRCKGITYDTGFFPAGRSSRPGFDPARVRREMDVIAGELRCDAVRVTGGDLDRMTLAARHAAAAGLEVWFSPQPCELDPGQTLRLLDAAASRAQELRDGSGAEVVLVLGGELSVFGSGFVPGADSDRRLASLLAPPPELLAGYEASVRRLNEFLAAAAAGARRRFCGPVTYAAGLWEDIDWEPFDIVSVDAYRDASNAGGYRDLVRGLTGYGKPAAVTEFGCCTYRGAADRGASGWAVVSGSGPERRIDARYQRDEREQAGYLRELLDVYEEEGIDSAFWFSFANYDKPRRPDPREDLDLASYGLVAVLEAARGPVDPGWVPKEAFAALARHRGPPVSAPVQRRSSA
jgi:hypothetical protein